jgi:broad specificity phosphatase PhoE
MIYYVRHGESEANQNHTYAGQRDDCLLTAIGLKQAKIAGKSIKDQHLVIDQIVSSPLKRARKTARIIAHEIGFDPEAIIVDPAISEYDMGSLTGKPMPEQPIQTIVPDDAEDPHEFQKRVMMAMRGLSELSGNTLVVSHAGVGKVIEATRQHKTPEIFHNLDGYPQAEVIELKFLTSPSDSAMMSQ